MTLRHGLLVTQVQLSVTVSSEMLVSTEPRNSTFQNITQSFYCSHTCDGDEYYTVVQVHRRFGGKGYLNLQRGRVRKASNQQAEISRLLLGHLTRLWSYRSWPWQRLPDYTVSKRRRPQSQIWNDFISSFVWLRCGNTANFENKVFGNDS
jgi:hypothetical protein